MTRIPNNKSITNSHMKFINHKAFPWTIRLFHASLWICEWPPMFKTSTQVLKTKHIYYEWSLWILTQSHGSDTIISNLGTKPKNPYSLHSSFCTITLKSFRIIIKIYHHPEIHMLLYHMKISNPVAAFSKTNTK